MRSAKAAGWGPRPEEPLPLAQERGKAPCLAGSCQEGSVPGIISNFTNQFASHTQDASQEQCV